MKKHISILFFVQILISIGGGIWIVRESTTEKKWGAKGKHLAQGGHWEREREVVRRGMKLHIQGKGNT